MLNLCCLAGALRPSHTRHAHLEDFANGNLAPQSNKKFLKKGWATKALLGPWALLERKNPYYQRTSMVYKSVE